jgi:hypothetical protein
MQELESLRSQVREEKVYASDIAARPVEAGDKAFLDRIDPTQEDDR